MSPARALVAVGASSVAAVLAGSLIAVGMGPFLAPGFGALVRGPEDLDLVSLVAGYVVACAGLVGLWSVVRPRSVGRAGALGLALGGAVFFGGHLIVVGWAHVPMREMALAGLADPRAIGLAGVVVDLVGRR